MTPSKTTWLVLTALLVCVVVLGSTKYFKLQSERDAISMDFYEEYLLTYPKMIDAVELIDQGRIDEARYLIGVQIDYAEPLAHTVLPYVGIDVNEAERDVPLIAHIFEAARRFRQEHALLREHSTEVVPNEEGSEDGVRRRRVVLPD